jgi:hypothetical protein
MNKNTEYQNLIANGKCQAFTLVGLETLPEWVSWIDNDSFVAKHSYSTKYSHLEDLAQEYFGYQMEYAPSVVEVDRNNNIIFEEPYPVPNEEIYRLCKN